MNKPLLALTAGVLLLAACDNVDKSGTADKLITDIERIQDITLTPVQRTCVKDLVKSYSDSDLKALSKNTAAASLSDDFTTKLQDCLRGGPATTTTAASSESSTTTVPTETSAAPTSTPESTTPPATAAATTTTGG